MIAYPNPQPRIAARAIAFTATALLTPVATQASAATHRLNANEVVLFRKISRDSSQRRSVMKLDPILCKVARNRARDMARNSYFSHVDRFGRGPNLLVKFAGYTLPSWYDMARSGNSIESLALTTGDAGEALELWRNSAPHRDHVLGEVAFYQGQESIGVGAFTSAGIPSQTYYVFLSAPANQAIRPPKLSLKNPAGRVISKTR